MPHRSRRGFTMIDLLAAVAILLFAGSLVLGQMSSLGRSREMAYRAKCANTLRQIGLAFKMYANENNGRFPRGPYKTGAPLTQFTAKENNGNIFGGDVSDNDCTVPLFLLMRQDLPSNLLVCPATLNTPETFGGPTNTAFNRSNFTSPNNLSYSMQCPYPASTTSTFVWKDNGSINQDFAIAADISPGASGNSRNHGGEGQNVLYGDIHIQWQTRPICGRHDDNIYTYGASPDEKGKWSMAAGAGPADDGDSYLLPASSDAPTTTSSDTGSAPRKSDDSTLTTVLVVAGILVAGGIAGAAWYWNKKRNWAPPMVGG